MASTPDAAAGENLAAGGEGGGEYEVGAALRDGWGGTIREGRYVRTGTRVTVEDIRAELAASPGLIERLAQAGRDAAALRSPHLVAVYDLVDDDAGYHLIAEWTDAPTLARVLRNGWASSERGIAIVEDVLAGLAVLHAAGLVHGQVGPETVVVAPDRRARLAELAVCAAAAPEGAAPGGDVREAARLGLNLLRPSDSRTRAVRRLLDAAVTSGSAGAAELNEEIHAAADAALGAGWRDRDAVAQAPTRRRRRVVVAALVALVAVGAGVAAALLLLGGHAAVPLAPGPLTVGSDASLTVTPKTSGCDTTFVFVGRGSLHGTGTLVFRWEQSDGSVTSDTPLTIHPDTGAFQLTQAWRLQGSQTVDGSMTLHILRPVDRSLHQSFRYVCP